MKHLSAIVLFLLILLFQLFLIAKVGAGDSEAYYYSWSRDLNFSYYDHPAGIAFLIRISTILFGHNTFALRFFSTILINLSLLCLYFISYLHTQNEKTSFYSMLFLVATPAFLIGGVSASPEPPLVFFCSMSLLFFYLYTKHRKSTFLYFSFIFSGIAFNFKYSAIFLTAGYFYILYSRFKLEKKQMSILLTITVISLLPVLIWNLLHRGASFEYHLIHRVNLLYIPVNILKLIGGQLLYFNPILIVLCVKIILEFLREKNDDIFLTLTIFLFFISSIPTLLIKDSEPHWLSIVYLPAAILCAQSINRYQKAFFSALTLNILLFGIFLFHIFSPFLTERILKNQNPKYDITNELFGWDLVAENIEYIVESENIPPNEVLLFSNHYTMSGQLMFATGSKYKVACRGKRCNQFTITDIKDESKFKLFIFVTDNRFTEVPRTYKDGSIQQKLKIYRGEKVIREFYLYVKKRI